LRARRRRTSLEATLIKYYHAIEKGLALAEPRPGFGRQHIETLLDRTAEYVRQYRSDHTVARLLNVLGEYREFHERHGVDLGWLLPRLQALRAQAEGGPHSSEGGTRPLERSAVQAATRIDFTRFVEHRYSVRQFSREPVTDASIVQAVQLARRTPSVCNRESGHVFVASSQEVKARLLALQNGNRGFGVQADKVLVITSRMETFLTVGERYQCWIDGGMFAMSLIYALHAQAVGTCCLNWSVEPAADMALKRVAGIPAGHAVIMLLAVGHLPEKLRVAQSPRRPLDEVLHHL
jgi:nitroreductase